MPGKESSRMGSLGGRGLIGATGSLVSLDRVLQISFSH